MGKEATRNEVIIATYRWDPWVWGIIREDRRERIVKATARWKNRKFAREASEWSGDAAIAIVMKWLLESFYDFTGHSKTGTSQNENY
jgi:hypothetical protein